MKPVSSILLVLCLTMISNLGFGESLSSLHPRETSVSTPNGDKVIQVAAEDAHKLGEPIDAISAPLEPLAFLHPTETSTRVKGFDKALQVFAAPSSESVAGEENVEEIPDPLESVNRAFFKFNDKFYFWLLKPVASGYSVVVPEDARIGVRNFFSNLTTPIRLVNCLLQVDLQCGGTETIRFLLNTTFGVAGFLDPAKKEFNIEKRDKDFGQTLGVYGFGPAFYIEWPILGPSSLRDTIGFVGDLALDPRTYVFNNPVIWVARPIELVNDTSLRIGEYEDLKKAAVDPYVAMRDAYFQYRQNKIKNR